MNLIYIVLEIYAWGLLLVAIRMGWYMLVRLDIRVWHRQQLDIWAVFVASTLAWPLLLIKPVNLLDPSKILPTVGIDFEAIQRNRDQLWNNPLPCGSRVRYRPKSLLMRPENHGEFILDASDVEPVLRENLRFTTNIDENDDGVLLNWLRHRDDTITKPTDVPISGRAFEFIVNDLVRSGAGTVRCRKCGHEVQHEQLVLDDDDCKPGNNYDRIVCPDGHILLAIDTGHFNVAPDS